MKTIKLALLLFVSTIIFSCQDSLNSPPPYSYSLNLKIVDNNGNDLIKGIPLNEFGVDNDICELRDITKGLGIGSINTDIKEDPQGLRIDLSTFDDKPQSVTFSLISTYIFKDINPRKITTTWEFADDDKFSAVCTSFKFEDKEFAIIRNKYSYDVTIIVD